MPRRQAVAVLAVFSVLLSLPALAQVTPRPGEVVTTPSTVFVPVPGGQSPGAPTPGQAMPPRDTGPRATTGTALIRGRVVDTDTGLPLRRANVQASQRARGEPRGAVTDDQGRFEITELSAGDYTLMVRKPGYAMGYYGQRRQGEAPRPLSLREGEVFERADVKLARGGVITGRVVDELGEPVLEAHVRVMQQRWVAGRKRTMAGGMAQTNDLGVYRVFGLTPGEYLVGVTSPASRMPFAASAPTEYAPVYYPGTSDLSQARPVTVAASQETLVDLAMSPTPVVRLTGIVLDSAGKPLAGGRVMARPVSADPTMAWDVPRSASTKPDGTFVIHGLSQGTWMVSASQPRGFNEPGVREMARLEVAVADQHVEGVTLTMSRGATVRGRVVFEGGSPPDPSSYRMMSRPIDPLEGFEMGASPEPVKEDGTFELTGLFGRRTLTAFGGAMGGGAPQAMTIGSAGNWAVKEVLVGGRDVQDTGVEFAPGAVVNAQVVMARDFPEISGTVATERGAAVTDYSVLVFSEDREKWFLPSGRFLRTARSNQDGQFKASSLAPGRYLLVAAESFDPNATGDPDELERLRALATEVTLGENEKKTVALTLVTP